MTATQSVGRRVWKKVEELSADGLTSTVQSHQLFLYRGYLRIAALDLSDASLPAQHFIRVSSRFVEPQRGLR